MNNTNDYYNICIMYYMKRVAAVILEDIDKAFIALQDIQKQIELYFKLKIEDHNIIISYDDGLDRIKKYLILDVDKHLQRDLSNFIGYEFITIGINKLATITLSSTEDRSVFCIQREFSTNNHLIEQQEIIIRNELFNQYSVTIRLLLFAVLIIVKGNDFDYIKELLK